MRDGAFDVAIVTDLSVISAREALLVRLRRVVGGRGSVVVGAPNRDVGGSAGLDYYELYDLLAMQWSDVRMVARVPFTGVVFAELGEGEIDDGVAVRTELATAPGAPEWWVAVAGPEGLDRYSIVQLPDEAEAPPPASEPDAALTAAVLKASLLESQLEELRTIRTDAARDAEEARRLREALVVERDRSERLVAELDHERRLRERLAVEITAQAERSVEDSSARIAALEDGVRLAEQTIVALRERLAATEDALRESTQAAIVARAELAGLAETHVDRRSLARIESQLAHAAEHQRAHEAELVALEEKLRERGDAVAELEAEVRRREQLVREVLARTSTASGPATSSEPPAELTRKLDALARTTAELQSELEAAHWKIAELSAKRSAPAEPLTELDALREALALEHAARVRAESGEELQLARAELARQAVLLAQLSGGGGRGKETV